MRKFVAFLDRNYPWVMLAVGIAMMIYLIIGGINNRLDASRTCWQTNWQNTGQIVYVNGKRFAICGDKEPILKEIK